MRYYYPLSTKDFSFENIFATESISPLSFYSQRGFGIDYFCRLPALQLEDFLVFFSQPPIYELPKNSGDAMKYILSFSESSIDEEEVIFLAEGIVAYPKTVYFKQDDLEVLFFRERDQRVAVLKSEASLPTKGVLKYVKSFKLVNEADCKEFDLTILAKVKLKNEEMLHEIAFDGRLNFFKGFLYGMTVGQVGSKSKEEILLKRRIQEIINSYAELKNRTEYSNYRAYGKDSKKSDIPPKAQTEMYEHRLRVAIMECEAVFSSIFPGQRFEPGLLIRFLAEKFRAILPTFEAAEQYVNYAILDEEIFGASKLATLKSYFFRHTVSQNPIAYFEVLKDQAQQSIRNNYASKTSKELIDDRFKETIRAIERFIEQHFLNKSKDKLIDLSVVRYDYLNNTISIDTGMAGISAESLQEFVLVSNCILNMPKRGKTETSTAKILPVIETVSNLLSKGKHTKTSQLYQYLNNEIDIYSLERVSSVVMKNFVAFAFNPDSIEKLENFTESKVIEESWMSYAFWCAYNGFANTSRTFVKPVFESGNNNLQHALDQFIRTQFAGVNKKAVTIGVKSDQIAPSVETVTQAEDTENATTPSRKFYDEFVAKTYALSFSDFQDLILQNNKETLVKELKSKTKASKKEIEKMLIRYNDLVVNGNLF